MELLETDLILYASREIEIVRIYLFPNNCTSAVLDFGAITMYVCTNKCEIYFFT